jgi:hypothetical protein
MDDVIQQAIPIIEEAIEEFWQIRDEPAPGVLELFRRGELRQINMSMGEDEHELHIYDGGVLGGHDLILSLDAKWQPLSAYFDG